jgi:hypothetical protein
LDQTVARLTEAYRTQLRVYERILELACAAETIAREGRPLAELHAINVEKRGALADIESIERRVVEDKRLWRDVGRGGPEDDELDGLLTELRGVIEAILRHEQETDRWILRAAGLRENPLTI